MPESIAYIVLVFIVIGIFGGIVRIFDSSEITRDKDPLEMSEFKAVELVRTGKVTPTQREENERFVQEVQQQTMQEHEQMHQHSST